MALRPGGASVLVGSLLLVAGCDQPWLSPGRSAIARPLAANHRYRLTRHR
jgi:hypothetical protein